MNYLFVGLGGFFGGVVRYAVSCAVRVRVVDGGGWSLAAFAVILAGSFLIGTLIGYFNNSTMPMHSCYLFCGVVLQRIDNVSHFLAGSIRIVARRASTGIRSAMRLRVVYYA